MRSPQSLLFLPSSSPPQPVEGQTRGKQNLLLISATLTFTPAGSAQIYCHASWPGWLAPTQGLLVHSAWHSSKAGSTGKCMAGDSSDPSSGKQHFSAGPMRKTSTFLLFSHSLSWVEKRNLYPSTHILTAAWAPPPQGHLPSSNKEASVCPVFPGTFSPHAWIAQLSASGVLTGIPGTIRDSGVPVSGN